MTGSRPLDRMIWGILSRTSLPWLTAALPAVCGSCDPAISTDSGIVDARNLWIRENTSARSGYFRYLAGHRRDGNVVTADERRLSRSLRDQGRLVGDHRISASCVWLAGNDHPGLVGEDDRLHAVAQPELGQHVADMGLDGRLADEQGQCDLGVAAAPREQHEHVPLPRGQDRKSTRLNSSHDQISYAV